jgi:ureidoacrylate peracid hydrolase
MHGFVMPNWATERVVRRQGKPSAHADAPAERTAFLVVDMQNYFLAPGAPAEVPMARAIVPNINRLASSLRAAGGTVVWIRTLFTEQALRDVSHFHHILLRPEVMRRRCAELAEEAEGSALWPELDVQAGDMISRKTRYSAFIQGASDLHDVLRQRGIEAVLVGGTMTNVCCDSTARDAMMLNYRTTMVSDANASATDEEHSSALINFHLQFGDVVTTDDVIARYQSAAAA